MSLMIYNSLTNKLEEFKTHTKGVVNMYVCGPTVYNYPHIGNARPVVFYDMLKNYLTYIGYKVNYASNVTDVDDKIINKALAEGLTEKEIATRYENAYFNNCESLGASKPDFIPHATDYIDDMVSAIDTLVKSGYAYNIDGDVFFRINKLSNYGILSNQVKEDLQEGVRIDVSSKKESPLDFALWKNTDKGIKWDSPYGAGRPGWHTECVCMIDKLFNHQMIDIHGGGMDLKFPHHENEIAQAQALNGNTLASFWMHVGRLNLGDGEKMSKSLGNVILVNDFKSEQDLMTLRFLMVTQPYRNAINYTQTLFDQYKKEYEKYQRAYKQACLALDYEEIYNDDVLESDKELFISHMNNDLNCQNVMSQLASLLKEINTSLRSKNYETLNYKTNMMKQIMDVLGVKLNYTKLTDETRSLYTKWNEAKAIKDFEKADNYRNQLIEAGVI